MARTLDPVSHAVRRDAFLDAAQRLIQSKGYDQMALQDVLDDLGVSKGAFYHYFGSKEALLAAVIDRMVDVGTAAMAPVANDPNLAATEKLTRMFSSLAAWKGERTDLMIEMVHVWLSDANAVVRDQLRIGTQAKLTPLLATVARQGKDEGTFTIKSPEHTAGVLVAMLLGTNETASRLFLARQAGEITFDDVECTLAAHAEAFERVLGLPPGSWPNLDTQTMHFWFG
jgi:AcrR family transcriptional regulator